MKEYEVDGFKIRETSAGIKYLLLSSSKISDSERFMRRHDIRYLEINEYKGYQLTDLDVLKKFDFIQGINVVSGVENINGLLYLKDLESLILQTRYTTPLDFAFFKSLKKLVFSWQPSATSLFECVTLEHLGLFKYKHKNLEHLKNLTKIKFLEVGSSPIESLSGLEHMTNLEILDLNYLRKLDSLKGIEKIGGSLKELLIDTCKKLYYLDEISSLQNLRKLRLNNLGEIASIYPLKSLPKLEISALAESTNIKNGDVTPLIGIKYIAFMDRKHYNYTKQEIKDKTNEQGLKPL